MDLNHFDTPQTFREELTRLLISRRQTRLEGVKRKYRLTKATRKLIHQKTDGRCHICDSEVPLENFEADHVKAHSSGGTSIADNFLPACKLCNNYRWHYRPDEIKWILKLGIWNRSHILKQTPLGVLIAESFVKNEIRRERRRTKPRT